MDGCLAGRRKHSAQLSLLEPAGHVPTAALDRTRATFWDVVRATEVHRYKVVLVENVVEAVEGTAGLSDEVTEVGWFTAAEAAALTIIPNQHGIVDVAFGRRPAPFYDLPG